MCVLYTYGVMCMLYSARVVMYGYWVCVYVVCCVCGICDIDSVYDEDVYV